MNDFELVIFDCDGVLVDSERIANETYALILKELCGLSFNLEQMYDTFVGKSAEQCQQIIHQLLGQEPPKQLQQRYKQEVAVALANSLQPIKGIQSALASLAMPYCVASNSNRQRIEISLQKTAMLAIFTDRIFSCDDVEHPKPYPDIYLFAAQNMGGVKPEKCLVIEDSPTGIKSALAAGMTVFGYTELMPEANLLEAGAHHTFNDMRCLNKEIDHYTNMKV